MFNSLTDVTMGTLVLPSRASWKTFSAAINYNLSLHIIFSFRGNNTYMEIVRCEYVWGDKSLRASSNDQTIQELSMFFWKCFFTVQVCSHLHSSLVNLLSKKSKTLLRTALWSGLSDETDRRLLENRLRKRNKPQCEWLMINTYYAKKSLYGEMQIILNVLPFSTFILEPHLLWSNISHKSAWKILISWCP